MGPRGGAFVVAQTRLEDRPPDLIPSEHLLRLRQEAEAKFADRLVTIPRG